MRPRRPDRANLLFIAVVFVAFVLVFWALFGRVLFDVLGGAR